MSQHTATIHTPSVATQVTYTDQGAGHPFLLLHGGAGPQSVSEFAQLLASTRPARVIAPTHPGFGGTPRPEGLASIAALAATYVALLDELDLEDVTVIGNSIGGWMAAELGLLHSPRVSSIVIVDAVGLTSETEPIVDFFGLTMDEITDLSYFAPDRFRLDLDAMTADAGLVMASNRAALSAYGGSTMADSTLLGRLPGIDRPTLVVWGAADRIVRPSHGRAYADAIPDATLQLIPDAGHLPQLETPQQLVTSVWTFAAEHATRPPIAP